MLRTYLLRFYEEDKGDNPVAAVEETPAAVVHATEGIPETTVHVTRQAAEIPPAGLDEFKAFMEARLTNIETGINDVKEDLRQVKEGTQKAATEPVEEATETAEDIAPEIIEPPKERYVRRNGRRVRR